MRLDRLRLRRHSKEPAHESLAPEEPDAGVDDSGGHLALRLPDEVSAAPLARSAVDVVGFGLSSRAREDAQLVVSELVTNALQHGGGDASLWLESTGEGRLVGEVVDGGSGFQPPPAVQPPATESHGRGLWVVASLAERWGVRQGTTRVWFEMPRDAA